MNLQSWKIQLCTSTGVMPEILKRTPKTQFNTGNAGLLTSAVDFRVSMLFDLNSDNISHHLPDSYDIYHILRPWANLRKRNKTKSSYYEKAQWVSLCSISDEYEWARFVRREGNICCFLLYATSHSFIQWNSPRVYPLCLLAFLAHSWVQPAITYVSSFEVRVNI